MKKWVGIAAAFAIFAILAILSSFFFSCNRIQQQIEQMKPEIRETTLEWGSVTADTTEIIGTIRVYNPNPISLPVKKMTYDITMAGVNMGSGESPGFHIAKQAESPIKVTAKIDNSKIPIFWVEHLKNQEKSEASIGIKVTFDLKITDFTFPFNVQRPIDTNFLAALNNVTPILLEKKVNVPVIGEQTVFRATLESLSGKWGMITTDTSEILLSLGIRNENIYPLVAPKMEYGAEINNITLASGEAPMQFVSQPNSTGNINMSIKLDNSRIDDWFVTHIQQGEKSTFKISVALVFDIPAYGPLSIPIWESSQEIVTDILGNG
jgi:LEA14-like dessication related protein